MSDRTELPAPPVAGVTIPVAPGGDPVPSFAQERLWFMDAYAPDTTAYTIPEAWRLRGAVDPAALAAALCRVASRHEPLRTRFATTADGRPVPVIDLDGRAAIPLRTAAAGALDAATALVEAFVAEPFDLATGPVARALLVTIAPDEHVLAFAVHHVAADGWSTEIVLDEVLALLTGRDLPQLPVRHRDVAAWQRARNHTDDLAYWRTQLAGIAPLELPTDRPRPPTPTHAGAAHRFAIDPDTHAALLRWGRTQRATPYMVVLAVFAALLGRRARQDDVVIGSPTAGRPLPELDDLVGCFVTMLTMRVDVSGDPTFAELLGRVRSTAGHAFAHQDLPFERLVTELNVPREVSRSPLFQVVFSLQSYAADRAEHPLLAVEGDLDLAHRVTRFDLELHAAGDGGFLVVYNTALFDAATITALAGHFAALAAAVVADPHAPVSVHDLLTPAERADRERWNATDTDLGPPALLHAPVQEAAGTAPERTAVIHPGGVITHGELDRRAGHVAAALATAGVSRGDLVGVVMERGWEQVVAVLAVNQVGAAYLPVDADLPARRRAELLTRGGCAVALVQPSGSGTDLPDGVTALTVTDASEDPAPPCPAAPDDLAYVIFTSGSTGTPKGVMISHGAALNTVRDITARFGIGPHDRVFALSALSFDLSVYDVYGTLAAGAALVMGPPADDKDPAAWARTVTEQRITVWNSVPALVELLVEHAERHGDDLASLRLVLMSGDWIPPSLPDRIRALAPDAAIVGLGGATEGSIWSIAYPIGAVDPSWTSIPYGRPLANQQFHVLDRGMGDAPVGVPGELYIGGVGVADGYWRDPERTAAAFVTHPRTGARLYRTGDLGRYHPDGLIEFLGRADSQVKIRGYRVELGEIEAHLVRHPGVVDGVVTVHGTGNAARLVAYLEASPGGAPDTAALRTHLAAVLPAYMVPGAYVVLPGLPLTANGKVDRGRLPAPAETVDTGGGGTAPSTPSEQLVHAACAEVLGIAEIDVDANFFDLGGHSLLAITVVQRLREATGSDTPIAVMDLFTHPTVRQLAALLDDAAGPTPGAAGLLRRLTAPRDAPPGWSVVVVPYGGGGAPVYTALAAALPERVALWSVGLPGHDPGVPEPFAPLVEVAQRCAAEIADRVTGQVVLYGHCGVGSALVVEIARRLTAAGRPPEALYLGGVFPFARPGRSRLTRFANPDVLRSDRAYAAALTAQGLDTGGLDPAQIRRIVRTTRHDNDAAEEYFTALLARREPPLPIPVISVVGEHDAATEYHRERFREWHTVGDVTAVVVLDDAGHYFCDDRPADLAAVLTATHEAVAADGAAGGDRWALREISRTAASDGPAPGTARFLAVTAAQLVALACAAMALIATPIRLFLDTGSPGWFALAAAAALGGGLLVRLPAAVVVERTDRRTAMLAAGTVAVLLLGLLRWAAALPPGLTCVLLAALSAALAVQWLAIGSAAAQLVDKRHLDHAVGALGAAASTAGLLVPVAAVALLAAAGWGAVITAGLVGGVVAVIVTLLVAFPHTAAARPGPVPSDVAAGWRRVRGDSGALRWLACTALLYAVTAPTALLVALQVLAVGTLPELGWVLLGATAGGAAGAVATTLLNGPPRRRVGVVVVCTLVVAACFLVIGLWPGVPAIGVAVAVAVPAWTIGRGIRCSTVEAGPQRGRGGVAALHAVVAWSAATTGVLALGLVAAFLSGSGSGPGLSAVIAFGAVGIAVAAVATWSTVPA